jgi:hypothetical protein
MGGAARKRFLFAEKNQKTFTSSATRLLVKARK